MVSYHLSEMKSPLGVRFIMPGRVKRASVLSPAGEDTLSLSPATGFAGAACVPRKEFVAMKTTYLSALQVSGGWGTETTAAATAHPFAHTGLTLLTNSTSQARVTPPLAFEVEEFGLQIPEENWRHRHGVPQTLDFPSIRNWRTD